MPPDPDTIGVARTARRSSPSAHFVRALGRGHPRPVTRAEGAPAAAGVVLAGGGPAPGRPLLYSDVGFVVWTKPGPLAVLGEQHAGGTLLPVGQGTRA